MKKFLAALIISAVAISAFAAGDNPATYKLKDAHTQKTVTLGSLKGKYKAIYIDMFAKWCGPCQMAIPEVKKLNSEYGAKGVAFIGLDVWDTWQGMQDDIKARSIDYRVLFDPAGQGQGLAAYWGQAAHVPQLGIPFVVILDGKTLQMKGHWVGYDQSGGATSQQVQTLKKLGVRA